MICGYWMWRVKSLDEAIEWIKKCPNPTGDISDIELRPLYEVEDFATQLSDETRERGQRVREKIANPS